MKVGLSSYSFYGEMSTGRMTVLDAMRWAKEHGAVHFELVPLEFNLLEDEALLESIVQQSQALDLALSNYAISADFIKNDFNSEVERVKQHVDVAHKLGVKRMRHDAASRPANEIGLSNFISDLKPLTEACREIADYASQYGIVTSIENHGLYVQGSDRVLALVDSVDRPNFRLTLDIGNFVCTDENPLVAVSKCLPYASMVHLKDFYIRPPYYNPGTGWFQSAGGHYLRGAVLGQGDLDIPSILRLIKAAGYDGYLSLEFEGMENCIWGAEVGLQNARRLWDEIDL